MGVHLATLLLVGLALFLSPSSPHPLFPPDHQRTIGKPRADGQVGGAEATHFGVNLRHC